MSLRVSLYKEILQKKDELEEARKNGKKVKETDLPQMAVGCEYDGIKRCGFSSHSKYVKRPDKRYPFKPLLEKELKAQGQNIPQLPCVIWKKKRKPVCDIRTGEVIRYKKEVEKFFGTCAEDNAANCILYDMNPGQSIRTLKEIRFVHPVRTRTLKRERMCVVCRNIFTEP